MLDFEFEFDRNNYHINDCINGKVKFNFIKLIIKILEIQIIRKEFLVSSENVVTNLEVLGKFEIMDGTPKQNDIIPIIMYLKPYDLTPTYTCVNNRFSVKYYLNLLLIDSKGQPYFKQKEIVLWRKKIK